MAIDGKRAGSLDVGGSNLGPLKQLLYGTYWHCLLHIFTTYVTSRDSLTQRHLNPASAGESSGATGPWLPTPCDKSTYADNVALPA